MADIKENLDIILNMDTIEILLTWIRDGCFGSVLALAVIKLSEKLGPKDESLD